MLRGDAEQAGAALAKARLSFEPSYVDLGWLASMQEARDVQDAAIDCLGAAPIGYTLAATTAVTSRLLFCSKPVMGKLLAEYVYEPGSTICLPHGTLGLGAQFVFFTGAPVRDPPNLRSVSDSVLSCRMETHRRERPLERPVRYGRLRAGRRMLGGHRGRRVERNGERTHRGIPSNGR